VDQETIYAPRHGNDRLLLGLKRSLNECELDLLRQSSLSARNEEGAPERVGCGGARIAIVDLCEVTPLSPQGKMTNEPLRSARHRQCALRP
jgi:hypothetical protein